MTVTSGLIEMFLLGLVSMAVFYAFLLACEKI